MVDAHVIKRGWADNVAAVCVGGPFDGTQRVEPGPIFKYVEYPRVASYEIDPREACKPVEVTKGQYTAHMICGVAIWIDQSLTIDGAMRQLVEAYAVPPHLRARPPRSGGDVHG